ncbi:hypothetical protein Cri9333_2264 [Crinalium epipsammum PCC 9333]|uniref:Uncharacterized protein n=1 Tax=Crinalium epipsammum PCC 9333 TaxID=1173022 RepID=K9W025_9CYAN|nr:hypothetical protein [Crinalium epipsammum]AFZ13134.1 hypothetical protein Cri9333_2264 [Crinalium epipsammum PCC 9333]
MTLKIISQNLVLAQAPAKKTQAPVKKTQTSQAPSASSNSANGQIWLLTSGVLLLILIGLAVYGKRQIEQLNKKVKIAEFKTNDVQKKLKLALETIRKMETNPDLVHSRDFNLDYLRMRMDEEVFNFAILNQLKIKVKQIVSVALRPSEGSQAVIGIANTSGRQVDETFDVLYEMEHGNKRTQRVLFRIQIKLTKLPTQSTNATISEIVECIEKFLSLSEDHDNWQPTIQGRIAQMDWDQKAKPTPLLVLSQSSEGVNVSFRTKTNKRPLSK